MAKEVIPVGVVLDLKSPVGRVANSYMSMALNDFYAVNYDYHTRLALFTKDSGDGVIIATTTSMLWNASRYVFLFVSKNLGAILQIQQFHNS